LPGDLGQEGREDPDCRRISTAGPVIEHNRATSASPPAAPEAGDAKQRQHPAVTPATKAGLNGSACGLIGRTSHDADSDARLLSPMVTNVSNASDGNIATPASTGARSPPSACWKNVPPMTDRFSGLIGVPAIAVSWSPGWSKFANTLTTSMPNALVQDSVLRPVNVAFAGAARMSGAQQPALHR